MKKNIEIELNELKESVKNIEHRIFELEKEVKNQEIMSSDKLVNQPSNLVIQKSNYDELTPISNFISEKSQTKEPFNFSHFESLYGKNIMGIIASILVFIGVSSFVVLIYDYLSVGLKVFLMYLFSAIMLSLGFYLVKKHKNTFNVGLSGCGIGLFYISILMTYLYFNLINQVILLILLLVWGLITLYLSKWFSFFTFEIIGYIGTAVSVLLGLFMIETRIDFYLLFLFYCVLTIGYFLITTNKYKSVLFVIGNILYLLLVLNSLTIISGYIDFLLVMGLLSIGVFIILQLYKWIKQYYSNTLLGNIFTGLFIGLFVISFNYVLLKVLSLDLKYTVFAENLGLYSILFSVFFILFLNKIKIQYEANYGYYFLFALLVFLMVNAMFIWDSIYFILPYIGSILVCLLLLVYNYFKKDKVIYYISLFALIYGIVYNICNFTYFGNGLFTFSLVIYGLIILSYIFATFYVLYKQKLLNILLKNWLLGLSLSVITFVSFNISRTVEFLYTGKYSYIDGLLIKNDIFVPDIGFYYIIPVLFLSIIVICLIYSSFAYNWNISTNLKRGLLENRENAVYKFLMYLNNVCLMGLLLAVGFYLSDISDIYLNILKIISILVIIILSQVNIKEDIIKKNSGFYIGIKYTLILNILLSSYVNQTTFGFLSSLLCIILAILSIIMGISKNIKSFRLYGLILSLLSVTKLVLIDINYTNSMLRVISFILSGLLCFGIVWVYDKFSKSKKK